MSAENAPLTGPSAYRPPIDRLLIGLALLGVLVVIHLWIMAGRGFDRGCFGFSEPTAVVECEAVIESDAGDMFGVSNIIWGLFFYLFVVGLSIRVWRADFGRARVRRVRAAFLGIGFLYSAYLVYIQSTQIGSFCKLCLISAGIVTIMAIVAAYDQMKTPTKPTSVPMREPALYIGLLVFTLVVAGADVGYFSALDVVEAPAIEAPAATQEPVAETALPAVPATADTCPYDPDMAEVSDYQSLVTFSDPFLGTLDAPVTIIELFDPNCPHCRTMHPIMKRVLETHADRVRFVMIPFVLWPESLPQIEAMYVAAQEGKFYEMVEGQFARQKPAGLSIEELKSIATEIGMDANLLATRVERSLNREAIIQRRQFFASMGVKGVPILMLNGRWLASESKTLPCIIELVDEAVAG